MKVLAVYHNKGGVGKTTTVINLAAALSKKNKRILIIDLDGQANTTFSTGLVRFQDEQTDTLKDNYVYHVIANRNTHSISEVAQRSDFTTPPFDVIPSHIDLMRHEDALVRQPEALTRLLNKLSEVKERYDVVLIDTPPSLNLWSQIALITADYLLIPSDLRPFANEGLQNVRNFVSKVDEFRESIMKQPIELIGVVASKISTSPKFVQYTLPRMIEIVEQRYGLPVLSSIIYERREISKALEEVREVGDLYIPDPISIIDFAPSSPGAQEFESLAHEVMGLIQI